MEESISILDSRLPQPREWDDLPQPGLAGVLKALAKLRRVADAARVEVIDHEMLRLLQPYRKDQ